MFARMTNYRNESIWMTWMTIGGILCARAIMFVAAFELKKGHKSQTRFFYI
jgi:hypothetical protein